MNELKSIEDPQSNNSVEEYEILIHNDALIKSMIFNLMKIM